MAKYSRGAGEKVKQAMHEQKEGSLKSGRSGKKVTSREQAIAIGLAEAREKGEKVPARKAGAKKAGTKKTTGKKPSTKRSVSKKSSTKRTTQKKNSTRRSVPEKTTAEKSTTKK